MRNAILNMIEHPGSLTVLDIVVRIFVATVIGVIIYISYYFSHQGTSYSRKFNVTLILLSVLTASVMTVIGNNVALSLGMVGALSIVRFRTAIKDARDTAYIFWTIIVGIACGVGDYIVAAVGSTAAFILLLFLGRIRDDGKMLLIIRGSRALEREIEAVVFKEFDQQADLRVKNTTENSVEFIYSLSRKVIQNKKKKGIIATDVFYRLGGIEYVNLVAQNDEIV